MLAKRSLLFLGACGGQAGVTLGYTAAKVPITLNVSVAGFGQAVEKRLFPPLNVVSLSVNFADVLSTLRSPDVTDQF